ncbi:DUF6227 family protein [Streptomyces sp. CBMA152]|uniref:DUF6227 family protein n=1 Tax=Streptomyces sp. CBMA152 TaxID=1896312 RepID=UPI0016609CC1|nr:DUF6227 family protein [Streptomyces sp. CBMA152]MBD0746445.1 hypothetical protein [Streptomyces sp. CBMA152]
MPNECEYETTEEHVAGLLGRALNSFELPDELVDSLDSALAHTTSLHSSLHVSGGPGRPGLSRETYRHTYLLLDGATVTLWELVHQRGNELYADEESARLAAARLDASTGLGHLGYLGCLGELDGVDGLEPLSDLAPVEPSGATRMYVPDDSADHARRLLRRAENPDRPGEPVARLLRGALAHQITRALGGHGRTDRRDGGVILYEHAFLLLDGTELSLWEVEHTATPDGSHMCEVYASQDAARRAMERLAHVS